MSRPDIHEVKQQVLDGRETDLSDDDILAFYKVSISGKKIYSRLSSEIKKHNRYKFIAINVHTGEYVIGDSEIESMRLFRAKFGDLPSWGTQIVL